MYLLEADTRILQSYLWVSYHHRLRLTPELGVNESAFFYAAVLFPTWHRPVVLLAEVCSFCIYFLNSTSHLCVLSLASNRGCGNLPCQPHRNSVPQRGQKLDSGRQRASFPVSLSDFSPLFISHLFTEASGIG